MKNKEIVIIVDIVVISLILPILNADVQAQQEQIQWLWNIQNGEQS